MHEMTLTFVPKDRDGPPLSALSAAWMMQKMIAYTEHMIADPSTVRALEIPKWSGTFPLVSGEI